ncbi:hypothetical protein ACWGKQ_11095 [Streptomyces sp. NPDC054770]
MATTLHKERGSAPANGRRGRAGPGVVLVAQVARSCGFGSHASVATALRAEFGAPPSEARRRGAG